ncbi:MAG: diaminopimelate epimerase [Armatimonadota bacterium]|jgi:diaminopimelate epimerase
MSLRFTKMHGLGNDYVYVDGHDQNLDRFNLGRLSALVSDRHFGVGSDGLILILPSEVADFRMRIFNPDESESNMCGNGMRCCAKYVYEHGLTDRTELTFETLAGIIKPVLTVEDGEVTSITVDMGEARLARGEVPFAQGDPDQPAIDEELEVDGQTVRVTAVSVGNPHCILFVDSVEDAPVTTLGPKIEYHPAFPNRTNVEFIEIVNRSHVKMRVWERGAGETLACGTGASATCVACALNDLTDRAIEVELLGGTLAIEWRDDNHVFMTGPAVEVFEGVLSEKFIAPAII